MLLEYRFYERIGTDSLKESEHVDFELTVLGVFRDSALASLSPTYTSSTRLHSADSP